MASKDFACTATMPVIYSSGSGANPGDLHLPVGKWDPGTGIGYSTRALLKASVSFAGMASITSAQLRLYQHTGSGWHAKGSGSVNVGTRRKTSDWSEGGTPPGTGTGTDEVYGGTSGTLVSGGFTDDGDPDVAINNGAADSTVEVVDITRLVRAWFEGAANYGVMVFAADSSTDPDDACEFYSRRASGKVPEIRITYETNQAPNAPTGLNPTGAERVDTGRTITYTGTRSDPDSGDTITSYQIEVYTDGHGTKIQTYTHPGLTPGYYTTFSRALTLPSSYAVGGPEYEWRARTCDADGAWGAWSSYQTFRPNTVPSTPGAPSVETDTLAPVITGTFSDPDPGNVPNQAEVHVERTDTGTDYWLSGAFGISTTPWTRAYGGSALAWGVSYRARVRTRDALGGWSSWSSWRTWTPTQPTGPDACTPRTTATKLGTLTPTLHVGHSASFRNDEVEVYATNSLASTRLWLKAWEGADYAAATGKDRVYAGTALAWGGTYWWRARIEDTSGVASSWTALMPVYVNAEPLAASGLTARNDASAEVVETGGVALVTDTTPILEAVYQDPDLGAYGDLPSSRVVEVYDRNPDGSAGALRFTNTLASPPYTVPMTFQVTAAMPVGATYLHRWRFADGVGRLGPWSAYGQVKVTTGPGIVLVAPANASVVTDQTPTVAWDYTSAAGKAQASYLVELYDGGPVGTPGDEALVHDSGVLTGADESYTIPPGIVVDGRSYRWQVTVRDTDGLAATLT